MGEKDKEKEKETMEQDMMTDQHFPPPSLKTPILPCGMPDFHQLRRILREKKENAGGWEGKG